MNSISRGVTLIELMIVVAIIGIITAIGYPSYQSMIISSHRGTAESDLMALAAAMERNFNANFSYLGAAEEGADEGSPNTFATHSPAAEPFANRRYDLVIQDVNAQGTTFELRANPVAGTSQADDGYLAVFSDGRRAWDQNKDGSLGDDEFCWSC